MGNNNLTRDRERKIKARDKPERNDESRVRGKGLNNQVEVEHKLLCQSPESANKGQQLQQHDKLRRLNESVVTDNLTSFE